MGAAHWAHNAISRGRTRSSGSQCDLARADTLIGLTRRSRAGGHAHWAHNAISRGRTRSSGRLIGFTWTSMRVGTTAARERCGERLVVRCEAKAWPPPTLSAATERPRPDVLGGWRPSRSRPACSPPCGEGGVGGELMRAGREEEAAVEGRGGGGGARAHNPGGRWACVRRGGMRAVGCMLRWAIVGGRARTASSSNSSPPP